MSRLRIDIDNNLDFDLEEGDIIVQIKNTGEIGKVCMPDMTTTIKDSRGYKKFLECIEILKPGTANQFIKYYQNKRKGKLH